ncbi:tetraspanin-4 [Chryseobacterium sp. StRB126]|uniref:hypothetical protein n=1 Tax=Chryseobacterium sp. StRB126 TaxID=878220 RepID=UPI0004E99E96|nr:hypothetical protein [Chryseobacterium sp. StRB126]BAP30134.1 tetraspanin-4 [Chryseobacterium sp. StRB126]
MTINGLENNYYLTQNDIWVLINGFTDVVSRVLIDFKNLSTNEELNGFDCSSSPNNDCTFNVCFPIRALMPELDHINVNTLQSFQIKITAKFKNTTVPDEVTTINKYFIRGGRDKAGSNEWFINDGGSLVVNKWISGGKSWSAPTPPLKISGGVLTEDTGIQSVVQEEKKTCNGILIKYLNSLGCYQYFYFDRYELKNKTKASKTINQITNRLRKDNFQNIGYTETKILILYSFTEKELQSNFEDLIKSLHILYFDPNGVDMDSAWHLIKLDDNSSTWNNYENAFENKAEFTLPNYRTIQI